MQFALALDLGTTSISAVALDERGRIAGKAGRSNTAAIENLPAGHAEHAPLRLRAVAVEVLRELAEKLPRPPHCLGLTGQMHSVLLLDGQRQPVSNLITWQDRRANERLPGSGKSYLEDFLSRCSEPDLSRTGCRLAPGYMGVSLFVLVQQQQMPPTATQAAFLADWIAAELCNTQIVTDRSNAASSGLYDLQRDCWSRELTAAGGIPLRLFPEVRESGTVIGRLTAEAARQTGLPAGLPVCNPIGDNQAAVLGSVPVGDPAIQINVGTGGQINWPIDGFLRIEGMDTRYLPQGRFMLVGAGLAGGDAYAWVKRTVAGWMDALGVGIADDEVYARMNELAARYPTDNDGLICEPLFRGTRRDPLARGLFRGISADNFTLGHVSRAVIQGIAAGMHSFYDLAGEAAPHDLQRIVGSGNGLRKNPLLAEAISRAFSRKVWFPVHQEEAAFGAALLAGSNTGMWSDLKTAGAVIELRSAAACGTAC